jgi:hypothetical protein
MADLSELADATEVGAVVDGEAGDSVVVDKQAVPRRSSNGEPSKVVRHSFSVPWDEFRNGMTKRDIWDQYVRHSIKNIVREVKQVEQRLGRKLEFRSFNVPGNNSRRRTFTYERNGVFIGVLARRIDLDAGNGNTQDELEIIVQAEIGLAQGEDPEPVETPHEVPQLSKWDRFKGWNQ